MSGTEPDHAASWRLVVSGLGAVLAVLALLHGCRGPAPESQSLSEAGATDSLPPAIADEEGAFSSRRAWAHLEAQLALGPRPSGSEAAAAARDYFRSALEPLGARVEERFAADDEAALAAADGARPGLVHLLARLPGASDEGILLATPYSSPRVGGVAILGANEGASGPAVLLELARQLATGPREYTVWFAFIEGDADAGRELAGSRALAAELGREGWFERVRAALFVERVGDADLQIARDLYSTRSDREEIWSVARELGYAESFATAEYESPQGAHRAFLDAGLRRAVALIDTRYGGTAPPGVWYRSERDTPEHCAPHSLEVVGEVALAALGRIEARLLKIDRFARRPVEETSSDARERRAASIWADSPAVEDAAAIEEREPPAATAEAPAPPPSPSPSPNAGAAPGPPGTARPEP